MTVDELRQRAAGRLGIDTFNGMQLAMASLPLPTRVLLLAPTGAGKTLAFVVPLLLSLPRSCGRVSALVVAPTRELVLQIYETVRKLGSPEYRTAVLYGGHSVQDEKASLAGGPDIIVATPGRLLDHLHRGHVDLHDVSTLILDEYDKSLELGFHKEIKEIMHKLRHVSTMMLTSATAAPQLPDFVDATGIKILEFFDGGAPAPDPVVKKVVSPDADKLPTLVVLLRGLRGRTLVFVNHRESAERVVQALRRENVSAGLYHGALEQDLRERALIMFGNGTDRVLVSTDLASRGLDIPEVENVVHYHFPLTQQIWTHRNGRTGRQGAAGLVLAIVSAKDKVPDFAIFGGTVDTQSMTAVEQMPPVATLYFNAGRREKISRGDIAGYILRNSSLEAAQLGRIDVRDHCAYAAVPEALARSVIEELKPFKLKNKRVRVSRIRND